MSNAPQTTPTAPNKNAKDPLRPDRGPDPEYDFEVPDGDEVDDGKEDVINVSGQPAKFRIEAAEIVLKPRQTTRIERAYTTEFKGEGQGDPLKPVVMRLTGDRVVPAWHKSAAGHEKAHNRKPRPLEAVPFERAKQRK